MTKDEILKDCELDAALKIYQVVGEPSNEVKLYEPLNNALVLWAADRYPVEFEWLCAEFKHSVKSLNIFKLRDGR